MNIHRDRPKQTVLQIGSSLIVALSLAVPAAAEDTEVPRVEVRVEVEREIVQARADGRRVSRREPVRTVVPGDVLVYTLSAHNVGHAPALNPRLQDPVPEGTVLIPDSVALEGTTVMASLDEGTSWQRFPVLVERETAGGGRESVPVPASAYTHLRWVLDGTLDPGEQQQVSFKVTIQ